MLVLTVKISWLVDNSLLGFPGGSVAKKLPTNAGDVGSIPGSGRSSEDGNGNPLQYSCLGESMDRGAGWPSQWGREELAHLSHTHDSLLSPLIISSGQNTAS